MPESRRVCNPTQRYEVSEFEVVAHVFALAGVEIHCVLTYNGLLNSGLLDLHGYFDCEIHIAVVGSTFRHGCEHAMELASVAGQHFNIIADVFGVLGPDFEIGSNAGRTHFELIILGVTVEFFFNLARNGRTCIYVDGSRRINLDGNRIVGCHSDVDYKKVGARNCLVYGPCE